MEATATAGAPLETRRQSLAGAVTRWPAWLCVACLATACAALGPIASPIATEPRAVTSTADPTRTLAVTGGMVFYDRLVDPSHGVRFPPGTYTLEAQDDSYWYLRAPAPLETRELKSGAVSASHSALGGIMIGKSAIKTLVLPAAGYVAGEGGGKVLIWKLGGEFVQLEGREWSKSF
jgi:hypothetical protein